MIRVIVNGCSGKMGKEISAALSDGELTKGKIVLAGQTGRDDDLAAAVVSNSAQVVVDFTHPSAVYQNVLTILNAGAHAVVGTTGIHEEQRDQIDRIARQKNLGVLIAPSFSIGAILMMRFSAEAARYFHDVEIVEYHHERKADAPSGTAIATAEQINSAAGFAGDPPAACQEQFATTSRGASLGNIRIHALRLPGFVASQEVIFGARGETLKIRHDTIDRSSFIPGVVLGIKKIITRTGVVYGLENII